jgi:hypothetical protein
MVAHVLVTLLALAGLATTFMVWTGRWRHLAMSVIAPNWTWTVLPSMALILLTYSLHPLVGDAVGYVALPFAMWSVAMAFSDPGWYGPRWWRELDQEGEPMALEAPDNAYMYAAMGPGLGDEGSLPRAERMMAGATPAARIRGTLVTNRFGRPSALQKPGVVEGEFLLYPRGIVFAASRTEDKMRRRAVVERLPGERILRVERLPRGTREGGGRSFRNLGTLVSSTLRIVADSDSWIVETVHGRRLLADLERLYGVHVAEDEALAAAGPSQPTPPRA